MYNSFFGTLLWVVFCTHYFVIIAIIRKKTHFELKSYSEENNLISIINSNHCLFHHRKIVNPLVPFPARWKQSKKATLTISNKKIKISHNN